jgi:prepilin-type N-terminal cleavage/methylation domain-containing protein
MFPVNHKPHQPAGERGFTLAEVVVAISLMSVVVVGLSGFAFVSSRSLLRSKKLSVATIAAHETLDSLRSLPYASLNDGNYYGYRTSGMFTFNITTSVVTDTMPQVRMLKHVLVSVISDGRILQQLSSSVYGGI